MTNIRYGNYPSLTVYFHRNFFRKVPYPNFRGVVCVRGRISSCVPHYKKGCTPAQYGACLQIKVLWKSWNSSINGKLRTNSHDEKMYKDEEFFYVWDKFSLLCFSWKQRHILLCTFWKEFEMGFDFGLGFSLGLAFSDSLEKI